MFEFQKVSKKDFNAIFRRSLVFCILARFEDPRAVEGPCSEPHDVVLASYSILGCCFLLLLTDMWRDGVFPKDALSSCHPVAYSVLLSVNRFLEKGKKACLESRVL